MYYANLFKNMMVNRLFVLPVVVAVAVTSTFVVGIPPAAAAPSTENGIHCVARGETLYSIAARYGTTVQAIMGMNRIKSSNRIFVGQCLQIPAGQMQQSTPTTKPKQVWYSNKLVYVVSAFAAIPWGYRSTEVTITVPGIAGPLVIITAVAATGVGAYASSQGDVGFLQCVNNANSLYGWQTTKVNEYVKTYCEPLKNGSVLKPTPAPTPQSTKEEINQLITALKEKRARATDDDSRNLVDYAINRLEKFQDDRVPTSYGHSLLDLMVERQNAVEMAKRIIAKLP